MVIIIYNNFIKLFQVPVRENREPGEIPGRTRHCKGELLPKPLLNWGKGQ